MKVNFNLENYIIQLFQLYLIPERIFSFFHAHGCATMRRRMHWHFTDCANSRTKNVIIAMQTDFEKRPISSIALNK